MIYDNSSYYPFKSYVCLFFPVSTGSCPACTLAHGPGKNLKGQWTRFYFLSYCTGYKAVAFFYIKLIKIEEAHAFLLNFMSSDLAPPPPRPVSWHRQADREELLKER